MPGSAELTGRGVFYGSALTEAASCKNQDVYIAGAKIERAYPFGPLPGCATMITLVSHGPLCCIGANVDPAAVTEPERFSRNLCEGFDEVLALGGEFRPTIQRT